MSEFEFLYDANLTSSQFVDQLGAILDAGAAAEDEDEGEGGTGGFAAVEQPKELRRHLSQLLSQHLILDQRDAQFCVMDSFEAVAESRPRVAFAALQQHFGTWPGLSHALLVLNSSCVAVSAAASGSDGGGLADADFFQEFLDDQAAFAALITDGHDSYQAEDADKQDGTLSRHFVDRFECASRSIRGMYEKCPASLRDHLRRAFGAAEAEASDPLAPVIVHALVGELVDAKGGTRKSDAVPIDAAELERALLRLFVARHVSPKQARGSVVGNFAFSGLLRVLSPEAFDEVLRDALTRAAARNPEVGVHALLALVEHCGRSAAVQACLESVVHPESKFGGALQLLRSDKAANRRFAVSFLGAFAARATNTFETLGGLFREIGALVDAPKAQGLKAYVHRAAAVDAVEAILPRIRSAGVALAPEELQELCELASAPVRTIVGDEDHVPTKARALEVLGRCAAAGGKDFGALAGANAACVGECLSSKGLEGAAIHALAQACANGAVASCAAVSDAFKKIVENLLKERLAKPSPTTVSEVAELGFVLMSLAKAAGTLDDDLAAGGAGLRKFLAPSSDIYSFGMHKKVAQQGTDALRSFQTALAGVLEMFLASPSNAKVFDPREFFDAVDDAAGGATSAILNAATPHPMIDLAVILLHSPLADIRRRLIDQSLAKGVLRTAYGVDASVQLLRRLISFFAELRPDDAWRQRPEVHLAAVKACLVPSRNGGVGTYAKKQPARSVLDISESRSARFALAASLVASCHPFCVPCSDPASIGHNLGDDAVTSSDNPFGRIVVDDEALVHAAPPAPAAHVTRQDWTRGGPAGPWRWVVARLGGRVAAEELLRGDGACVSQFDDDETETTNTVVAELERMLLAGGSGLAWNGDKCLRSMAQAALRALLRLPGLGAALAKRALHTVLYVTDDEASGLNAVTVTDMWQYLRNQGLGVAALEAASESLRAIAAAERKAAKEAEEKKAKESAAAAQRSAVKHFTTSKGDSGSGGSSDKSKKSSKSKAPKKAGKAGKGGGKKGNKLDFVTFDDAPSKKGKKGKGKGDAGTKKKKKPSAAKKGASTAAAGDAAVAGGASGSAAGGASESVPELSPRDQAVQRVEAVLVRFRRALVIVHTVATACSVDDFHPLVAPVLRALQKCMTSTRLFSLESQVMTTTAAFVAAIGCSQPALVARALQVVAGVGDNSAQFAVTRLAEEAKADAAVEAAAAAGLSVEDNADKTERTVPVLEAAAKRAAHVHSGLMERLLKPLFDSKAMVTGPQFRCLFPILDATVRSEPLGANFHKALLVTAVHCNPSMREQAAAVGTTNAFVDLRADTIGTVLFAVRQLPDAFPRPADVLQALCAGAPLSKTELEVLCGPSGFRCPVQAVRAAALNAAAPNNEVVMPSDAEQDDAGTTLLASAMWMACYDPDEDTSGKALAVWEAAGFEITAELADYAMQFLDDPDEGLRGIAAFAVAGVLESLPDLQDSLLTRLANAFATSLEAQVKASKVRQIEVVQRDGSVQLVDDTLHAARLAARGGPFAKSPHRCGVAQTIQGFAELGVLDSDGVERLVGLVVQQGLNDPVKDVRSAMREAGMALVNAHGAEETATIFSTLEGTLRACTSQAAEIADPTSHAMDVLMWQKQGVVVMLGALGLAVVGGEEAAEAADGGDASAQDTVNSIATLLTSELETPDEAVQMAVADGLQSLAKALTLAQQTPLINALLARLVGGGKDEIGARRGAAYGLAAIVKGVGIVVLQRHNIVKKLQEAFESRKWESKQGALFAFELMSSRLGILFEPYAIVILDLLLQSFADGSGYVQTSASAAARVLMGQLSGHGVKMILPKILGNMQDTRAKWQTLRASIVMLGAMSHCAPKQLSTCLPAIVPNLVEAFHNTHKKVRESAKAALVEVAQVVRNPEISSLTEVLIEALTNPVEKTGSALTSLTETSFVHAIDSPSLALIVPILQRGLRAKKTEVKRPAAVIVGSMCSLISSNKDLEPYLDALMPHIRAIVLDPIPEVRMVAATAISSLYDAMGETTFPDLVPWLLETLMSDQGNVERSGAAQSLSQILAHVEEEKATEVVSTVLAASTHPKDHVREGVMWMLTFLPGALPDARYSRMLRRLLEVVVVGLSDEEDAVRTVAMKAGEMCVVQNAARHAATIIPVLEEGLQDPKWRIRVATIKLLGDLLFEVGETHAIGDLGQEEGEANMASVQTAGNILRVLGRELRDLVIASVYIAKSDSNLPVRQHATLVWKSVVYNTPATIRDTLHIIMDKLFVGLVHTDQGQKAQAGRCLGEIVAKLGERVMSSILPVLEDGLRAPDAARRQGVCFGLGEVIRALPERNGESFLPQLAPPIRQALCDEAPGVRAAAAQAYKNLFRLSGQMAISNMVQGLLQPLGQSADSSNSHVQKATAGMAEVVSALPTAVLKYLVPIACDMSSGQSLSWAQCRAISAIARSSAAVDTAFNSLFNALFRSIAALDKGEGAPKSDDTSGGGGVSAADSIDFGEGPGGPDEDALLEVAVELAERTDSEASATRFVAALVAHINDASCARVRARALEVLGRAVKTYSSQQSGSGADAAGEGGGAPAEAQDNAFEPMLAVIFRELVGKYNDRDAGVLRAAANAFTAVISSMDKGLLAENIGYVRNQFNTVVSAARHRTGGVGSSGVFLLPGLNQTKGIDPLVPMLQHGLTKGTAEQKREAAQAYADLLRLVDGKYIQKVVIKITGPLIRILGDRYLPQVRSSVLDALVLLLDKGGRMLKAFVPQMQTSLVKNLKDAYAPVRATALKALKRLLRLSTRIDPLVRELCAGISGIAVTPGEPGPQDSLVRALRLILEQAPSKVSDKMSGVVETTLQEVLDELAAELGGSAGLEAASAQLVTNVAFSAGALAGCDASSAGAENAAAEAASELASAASGDAFAALSAACRLQGTLQTLTKGPLSAATLASAKEAALVALKAGEPVVAAKAAAVLIACAQHSHRHPSELGSAAGVTIADAFRTVENAFMTDRDRLLQRQVLAAILSLVRALDGPKSAMDQAVRDELVIFLGKCVQGAKRKSDIQRMRNVLSRVLQRQTSPALFTNYPGSPAARRVVAELRDAEEGENAAADEFVYDTDDEEFSWL